MGLPERKKVVSGFACLAVLLAAASLPGHVVAGPAEDYAAGLAAYRSGDIVASMAMLKRAADAGSAPAQALYGDILDRAELNDEAMRYLRMAADQGNADGQYGLAVMYLGGEGVAKNPAEAMRWLQMAAAQNHALAINALVQACISNDPICDPATRTSAETRALIFRAAESGYLPAIDALAKAFHTGAFGVAVNAADATTWAAKPRTKP